MLAQASENDGRARSFSAAVFHSFNKQPKKEMTPEREMEKNTHTHKKQRNSKKIKKRNNSPKVQRTLHSDM
jgi:hypothetical protein